MRMIGPGRVLVATGVVLSVCAGGLARAQDHQSERAERQDHQSERADSFIAGTAALGRLVEELKRHPAKPSHEPDRLGLYLMNAATGEASLIADEPGPGLTQCGSPASSLDGRIF